MTTDTTEALPPTANVWRWSSQTALPPINGQVRSDTAEWQAPANLYIEYTDDTGVDQTNLIAGIQAGDTVALTMKTDGERFAEYTATAATIDCGTYGQIPVSYQNGDGNLPNSSTQIVVSVTPNVAPSSIARWTITDPGEPSSHWASVVECQHGTTRNGVWLALTDDDDRNLLDLAPQTFANHQAAYPDCDCTLQEDWAPSYTPPVVASAVVEDLAAPAPTGNVAFAYIQYIPPWFGIIISCPHGWFPTGSWTQGQIPDLALLRQSAYANHQAIFGCGDPLAASSSTAVLTVGAISVAARAMQTIPEVTAQTTGSAFQWATRLSTTQAGIITVQATVTVARGSLGIAQGNGVFLVQGVVTASAPLRDDGAGHLSASISWTGNVASGQTLRLGLQNTSPVVQDVLNGTLNVQTAN